ncbi:MAG: cation:proton antiporter, partial [Rhizobiaceae bacterium]|nr:cation:proton antiporter [Rhizobiaceae bacterium]
VHTVLGAFVAGILIGESPILTRQIDVQLRALTTALFMPVFFGLTGLQTDLTILADSSTLLLTVGVILIASIGKFGGAFVCARMGGFSTAEAFALGCGMNARGSTEVIVATIGLAVGVLDERLFSVIVAMAVVTTMAMPPSLRLALQHLPMRKEEHDRLEKEEFQETSFLANFERLLVVGDQSDSSRLAARLAGYFAAMRRMPVTILDISGGADAANRDLAKPDIEDDGNTANSLADKVRATAVKTIASETDTGDVKEADIHVLVRPRDGELAEILGRDSEKGHDLLFAGIEPTMSPNGGFNDLLALITSSFKGTSAIVAARGHNEDTDFRILVPISGTERSVKSAEFALQIAKAARCKIAVLFVTEPRQTRSFPRISDPTNGHIDAFKKIDEIAGFYDVAVDKIVETGASAELTILSHARKGSYNLVILGVSRRESEKLSYGGIAEALLEAADRSFIFIEAE